MKRRDFIKNMGLFAASVSPVARIGGALGLAGTTTALSAEGLEGYKAIVIFDMDGGNDAMNMFPPTGDTPYETYKDIRTTLGVENIDLYEDDYYKTDDKTKHFTGTKNSPNQPYAVSEGVYGEETGKDAMYIKGSYHTGNGLGIHALMPEMASLYKKGVLSIVSNTGVLIEPTTKDGIEDESVRLPEFLFSHGNQRELVSTLQAGQKGTKSGWAGRLADNWLINGDLGLNISYGGATKLFMGLSTSGLTMSTRGPTSYSSYNFPKSVVMEDFEEMLKDAAENAQNSNIFDTFTHKVNKKTAVLSKDLKTIWATAKQFTSLNSYGDTLFTLYPGNEESRKAMGMHTHHEMDKRIFQQFDATAKMIQLSKDNLEAKRQIFYVRQSGHDVHGKQIENHSKHLRAISLSISDFYKALEEMGMEKEVLLISASDFGRTMRNNGDGTDHGWGGHSFMMCGDEKFNGGQVYGDVLEDLSFTGINAYTTRARIIPTTSIEQTLAPALKWFGVDDTIMDEILPNLKNFKDKTYEGEDVASIFS